MTGFKVWRVVSLGIILHARYYGVLLNLFRGCRLDTTRQHHRLHRLLKKHWGLKDQFNPQDFNPDQWVDVMEKAGMKYAIFTTKRHDGFNMNDTKENYFSITQDPFKEHPMGPMCSVSYLSRSGRKNSISGLIVLISIGTVCMIGGTIILLPAVM